MKTLSNKKVISWLDESDALNIDNLGRVVIEDKAILEAIAGGASEHDHDIDEALYSKGVGCPCTGSHC